MNFIFISPNFPHTYWQYCQRLKENGATVLGIGDAPYFGLSEPLRNSLTEYYYLNSLNDYDQVYRAVAFFIFKYGRIDWLESNNEFWMEQDARLRTDFNIRTGPGTAEIGAWKWRSVMIASFRDAGIPVPRWRLAATADGAREFISVTGGYPVVAKPDAAGTPATRIDSDVELEGFFADNPAGTYLFEEMIDGEICSYDAITDARCEPLFESRTVWPVPIAEVIRRKGDLAYWTCDDLPEALRKLGRKALKALNVRSRFVHLRFLHVPDREGQEDEWLALDANMRPADGYMPDVMNYAHSTDVYRIWADMVTEGHRMLPDSGDHHWCVYAGRRDHEPYLHSHEDIVWCYGSHLALTERVPESMPPVMGNQMYALHAHSEAEVREFVAYVHAKRDT